AATPKTPVARVDGVSKNEQEITEVTEIKTLFPLSPPVKFPSARRHHCRHRHSPRRRRPRCHPHFRPKRSPCRRHLFHARCKWFLKPISVPPPPHSFRPHPPPRQND